jgi:EpsD family peptidyl-prolyl cis-trans isomerase
MTRNARRTSLALVFGALATVAGCGQPSDRAEGQVAARVNSAEITVSEVNSLLAASSDAGAGATVMERRTILDKLIDDELARQQAVKEKLDESPGVKLAIKLAQTEILARSYRRHVAAGVPRPTSDEIAKYYAAHPELFAKRRIFHLGEISFEAGALPVEGLNAIVAKARSIDDVADWLGAQGVSYVESSASRAAEDVPLDVLGKLQAMTDGQIAFVTAKAGQYRVVQVVKSELAPVDEATAAPRIREYLLNHRAALAVADSMQHIRQAAKVVYMGEFAGKPGSPEARLESIAEARLK